MMSTTVMITTNSTYVSRKLPVATAGGSVGNAPTNTSAVYGISAVHSEVTSTGESMIN